MYRLVTATQGYSTAQGSGPAALPSPSTFPAWKRVYDLNRVQRGRKLQRTGTSDMEGDVTSQRMEVLSGDHPSKEGGGAER